MGLYSRAGRRVRLAATTATVSTTAALAVIEGRADFAFAGKRDAVIRRNRVEREIGVVVERIDFARHAAARRTPSRSPDRQSAARYGSTRRRSSACRRGDIASRLGLLHRGRPALLNRGRPALLNRGSAALLHRGRPALLHRGSAALLHRGCPALPYRGRPALLHRGRAALLHRGRPAALLSGRPAALHRGRPAATAAATPSRATPGRIRSTWRGFFRGLCGAIIRILRLDVGTFRGVERVVLTGQGRLDSRGPGFGIAFRGDRFGGLAFAASAATASTARTAAAALLTGVVRGGLEGRVGARCLDRRGIAQLRIDWLGDFVGTPSGAGVAPWTAGRVIGISRPVEGRGSVNGIERIKGLRRAVRAEVDLVRHGKKEGRAAGDQPGAVRAARPRSRPRRRAERGGPWSAGRARGAAGIRDL